MASLPNTPDIPSVLGDSLPPTPEPQGSPSSTPVRPRQGESPPQTPPAKPQKKKKGPPGLEELQEAKHVQLRKEMRKQAHHLLLSKH